MASDKIIHFSDGNFNTIVIKSRVPVLVNFWNAGSGPCRTLASVLDKLADEYDGLALIGSVNVEKCPQITREYRIASVPTLAILVDGITEQRIIGLRSAEELRTVLDKYVRRKDIGESASDEQA